MSSNKKMEVYEAKDGWRWRYWSSSDIVAESGEANESKGYIVKKATEFMPADAVLVVEGEVTQ